MLGSHVCDTTNWVDSWTGSTDFIDVTLVSEDT